MTKKKFKGKQTRVTLKDVHIKIDSCVGQSFLRSYAVLTSKSSGTEDIVAYYGRGVPKASGKRVVSMHVVFPPRKRMPDVDSLWKSLLDSLVHAGLLVNDSAAWASMSPVAYSRGESLTTFITVEDI